MPSKERYRPKGGNGGDRRSGSPSKMAVLAERQAVLSGKLPHILLAEWAQTGVMEQVVTTVKKNKGGRGVRVVAKRDEKGELIRETVVLDPYARIDAAKAGANYFAAKRKEQEKMLGGAEDPIRLIELSAERVRTKLLLALPAPKEEN